MIRRIAQTDHTQVWLCEHKLLKQERVVKIVEKSQFGARIIQEAHWMKQFRHDAIPQIYDVLEDNNSICIIEEYIAGKSLSEYLGIKQQLSVQEVIEYGIQLCEVLDYLHHFQEQGVLHLDLKPENIFINEKNQLKLLDFDHALPMGAESEGYGSVGYAAPEQYLSGRVNVTTDIYAVGMLLLYMTNQRCIQSFAEGKAELSMMQSEQLYPIIKKCIHHHSFQRYSSVAGLKQDLEQMNMKLERHHKNKKPLLKTTNYHIYVHGSRRGVGTTHVCLCLASYLANCQYRAVYVGHSQENDLFETAMQGVLQKNGTYRLHNIDILLNYQQRINCDISKYQFQIHDCGVSAVTKVQESFAQQTKCMQIYVTDLGYRQQQDRHIREQLPENVMIAMNHIDGIRFYQELKQKTEKNSWVRIPCIYNWAKCNEIFDETATELLRNLFGADFVQNCSRHKHTGFARIWSYFMEDV